MKSETGGLNIVLAPNVANCGGVGVFVSSSRTDGKKFVESLIVLLSVVSGLSVLVSSLGNGKNTVEVLGLSSSVLSSLTFDGVFAKVSSSKMLLNKLFVQADNSEIEILN